MDHQIPDNNAWANIWIFKILDLLKPRKTQQSLNSGSKMFLAEPKFHQIQRPSSKRRVFQKVQGGTSGLEALNLISNYTRSHQFTNMSITPCKLLRRTLWLLIGLIILQDIEQDCNNDNNGSSDVTSVSYMCVSTVLRGEFWETFYCPPKSAMQLQMTDGSSERSQRCA